MPTGHGTALWRRRCTWSGSQSRSDTCRTTGDGEGGNQIGGAADSFLIENELRGTGVAQGMIDAGAVWSREYVDAKYLLTYSDLYRFVSELT